MTMRRRIGWTVAAVTALAWTGLGPAAADAASPAPPLSYGPARVNVEPAFTPTATPAARPTATPGTVTRMTIVPVWDTSVTDSQDASKIEAAFNAAAAEIESHYSDPITVKIWVGYGRLAVPLPFGPFIRVYSGGESYSNATVLSYADMVAALAANAVTPDQVTAVAHLPATLPAGFGAGYVNDAQLLALGLQSSTTVYGRESVLGTVAIGSATTWNWDPTNPDSAGYDPVGVYAHEISEVLGRVAETPTGYFWSSDNLFDYSAPGMIATQQASGDYLSYDGGTTKLVALNGIFGADVADYADLNPDAFNAYGTPGVILPITEAGLVNLDLLGYHQVPDSITVTPNPATARPGSAITMTATGHWAYGGTLNETSQATFTLTNPAGTSHGTYCQANTCYVTGPGTYTATATYQGVTGSTTITVQP